MGERDRISIGGASGYWGEAAHATAQLLRATDLDFLAYDYLAEITMSIMARARAKDPQAGFAGDFVTAALAPNLSEIARRGIRVISNAGGVNPQACATAVRELISKQGLNLKVAVVTGDDLLARAPAFVNEREMFTEAPFPDPETVVSVNAYLGALPIARALDGGADIVITGRCVDSAVTLGACIHSFGWGESDFDRLAGGSLAGHLIECGPQATGGNFTDWRQAGDIADIGYPIARIAADGSCVITKPEGTTGVVSPFSVGEQMLYEIGDPASYLLPDVTCDFRDVTLVQQSQHEVRVCGARGRPASDKLKVSATYLNGFRAGQTFVFNGFDAGEKAQALAKAIIDRSRQRFRASNLADFAETSVELFGGPAGDAPGYGEVTLKLAARHDDAGALGIFLKEMAGAALATPAGMSAFTAGGRPRPSPVVRLFSFLIAKDEVSAALQIDHDPATAVPWPADPQPLEDARPSSAPEAPPASGLGETVDVPLIDLAVARSGDKGDKANIGVMARDPAYLPWIWNALTPEAVARVFDDFLQGKVERYYLPGTQALNLLLDRVLGGGGIASLRQDSQAKGFAQRLLAYPVPVPQEVKASLSSDPR